MGTPDLYLVGQKYGMPGATMGVEAGAALLGSDCRTPKGCRELVGETKKNKTLTHLVSEVSYG